MLDDLVAGAVRERFDGSETRSRVLTLAEQQCREADTARAADERQRLRLREKGVRLGRLLLEEALTRDRQRGGLDVDMLWHHATDNTCPSPRLLNLATGVPSAWRYCWAGDA